MSRDYKDLHTPVFFSDYPIEYEDGSSIIAISRENTYGRSTFSSQDNPVWLEMHNGPAHEQARARKQFATWDSGSSFTKETVRYSDFSHVDHAFQSQVPNKPFYRGPWLPVATNAFRNDILSLVTWPSLDAVTLDLFGLGGTGIKRTTPTRSHMSLGVALGELLREGLPTLIGLQSLRSGASPKGLGSEYLNFEFGIMPMLRDFRALLGTVKDSAAIIAEYNRKSSTHIRRRYEFPVDNGTINLKFGSLRASVPASSYLWKNGGVDKPHYSGTVESRAWFSGAYVYNIPMGDDTLSKIRRFESEANYLLGLRLTPDLIWNLSPWTWLLDWFGTVGDMVANISALGQDGLVLHYGYIMRHVKVDVVASSGIPGGSATPASYRMVMDQKARRRATPYGFGTNPSSLTAKQWSILGALGLIKAPGKFI